MLRACESLKIFFKTHLEVELIAQQSVLSSSHLLKYISFHVDPRALFCIYIFLDYFLITKQ